MKILFLGTYFPRPNNPIMGTWALSQILALRNLGHDVKAISFIPAVPPFVFKVLRRGTSANCPSTFSWDGIDTTYIRWPVYPVGPLANFYRTFPDIAIPFAWKLVAQRVERIASQWEPDVIFAHHGQHAGYVAAQIAERRKIPCFVAEHSFGEIESCENNPRRKRHYQSMVDKLSGWIAVSRRLHEAMGRLFPNAPIITVLNGAEPVPVAVRCAPRPAELSDRLVVLCVSFFYRRKLVPLLISAFDSIAQKYPKALLLIVGDGTDRPSVEASIRVATHHTQIRLLGSLQHEDVLRYMQWCDLFACIGVNEPFGVVFSEAMMAGKPIVYSNDAGISDVVTSGKQGFSVTPGDQSSAAFALDKLIGDDSLRLSMGTQAGELANSRLSWTHSAEQLISLFNAVRGAGRRLTAE